MENNSNSRILLLLKGLIITLFVIIFLNLLYIDFSLFRSSKFNNAKINPLSASITQMEENYGLCPNSCIAKINQATSSSTIIASTPTPLPISNQQEIIPTTTPSETSQVKEFFVPLGSGSNSSDDWQDVAGAKVSIDTTNYPSIKSVVFEALVHIPTGNEIAYVRLFNETDKHPIWTSEVSLEGGTPQLLVSKPITLDSGSKTYKVQMKTSLKFQAVLDSARIHILIN